jgi:hypothetical protein
LNTRKKADAWPFAGLNGEPPRWVVALYGDNALAQWRKVQDEPSRPTQFLTGIRCYKPATVYRTQDGRWVPYPELAAA